jgi:hypothetical protein
MFIFQRLLAETILLLILAAIDVSIFIGSYGILRLLGISVNWATWIVGTLIISLSVYVCLLTLFPGTSVRNAGLSNLLGMFSFLIAVHSGGQWTTRRWYLLVKKRATATIVKPSRELLLFLRQHHQFLGWLVVITAVAHVVFFLPYLSTLPFMRVITGVVALSVLAVLALFGLWIEYRIKKKRLTQKARVVHALLAITFFITFIVHII